MPSAPTGRRRRTPRSGRWRSIAARASSSGAAALYQAEVATAAPQRTAARFWLGRLALLRGDTAAAEAAWVALAHEDSIGYYGLRARREVPLPPLRLSAPPLPAASPAVAASLARLDTLVLAGLDTAAELEVRRMLGRAPQQEIEALLAGSGE